MAEWHYSRGNEQHGPVSSAQLKEMATAGQLQPTDLIWKDGMPGWVAAGKIKGLFEGAADAGRVQTREDALRNVAGRHGVRLRFDPGAAT